jgi:hypothetical protein
LPKKIYVILVLAVFTLFYNIDLSAGESFNEAARRALDEYEQEARLRSIQPSPQARVMEPDAAVQTPPVSVPVSAQRTVDSGDQAPWDGEDSENRILKQRVKLPRQTHEFRAEYEVYNYNYREKDEGTFFMGMKGAYNGISASYTFRPEQPGSFSEYVNMFRLEGRLAIGEVDYSTPDYSYNSIDDKVFEVRGLAGYDWQVSETLTVTPYAGMGVRHLFDRMSQVPAEYIDGDEYWSGYDRESNYYYVPLGADVLKRLSAQWTLGANLEYDFFLSGTQKSHLEDVYDVNGDNQGFSVLKNKQNKGMGLRGSLRVSRDTGRYGVYVEPFFRLWDIEQSSTDEIFQDGAVAGEGYEPKNTTREIGMKMGVKF